MRAVRFPDGAQIAIPEHWVGRAQKKKDKSTFPIKIRLSFKGKRDTINRIFRRKYGRLSLRAALLEKVYSALPSVQAVQLACHGVRPRHPAHFRGHYRLSHRLRSPRSARRRRHFGLSVHRLAGRAADLAALCGSRHRLCLRPGRTAHLSLLQERHLPVVRAAHGMHPARGDVRQAFGIRRRDHLPLQHGRTAHDDEPRHHHLQGTVFAHPHEPVRFVGHDRALNRHPDDARSLLPHSSRRHHARHPLLSHPLPDAGAQALPRHPRRLFSDQSGRAGECGRGAHRALLRRRRGGNQEV